VTAAVSTPDQLPTAVSAALDGALARFGHPALRAGQAEVIADIFEGTPVVAVMPTGAGKSLCYQLPAVLLAERGGVTLVVSPLIALMKDQVDALRARGIPAAALTSAADQGEQREILEQLRAGALTLLYVAPERFRSPRFVDAISGLGPRLALIAVDEAHCISEWGHDFRPDYRRLGEAVAALRPARLAAFTATATPEVRLDIAAQLGMAQARIHVRGFDRPNLTYVVEKAGGTADKSQRLIELVRTREGGVALVYAATRKNAEKYAAELKAAGMRARVYHAGLADDARESAQDKFMDGSIDVIVATNAFGMGVDKRDIRLVVHADIPRSPEAYYQEAGRGGRDGRATRCVLLFNHGDVRLQEFLIDASYPSGEVLRGIWKLLRDEPALGTGHAEEQLRAKLPGEVNAATVGSALRILERHGLLMNDAGRLVASKPDPVAHQPLDVDGLRRRAEVEHKKLRTMIEYAYLHGCRRQYMLAYFGDKEWQTPGRRCGACDNCDALAHGRAAGLSEEDAAAVRGVLTLVAALGGRFGRSRVAAIAMGTDEDGRFDDAPGRGCLSGWSQKHALDLLRALDGAGLIEASRGEYPTIDTTKRGNQAAGGKLPLEELGIHVPVRTKARGGAKRGGAGRSRFGAR
jgi:ATP-dependent DNA helicase RecQ